MHADGKSTLASVSKWNSGKVNFKAIWCEIENLLMFILFEVRYRSR